MEPPVIGAALCHTSLGDTNETWENLCAGKSGIIDHEFRSSGKWPSGVMDYLEGYEGSVNRLKSLIEKGLSPLKKCVKLPSDTEVVIATTKGAVDELGKGVSSQNIPYQPWNIANEISLFLGIKGRNYTVSGACASGTLAVINAAQLVMTHRAEAVIAVGLDIISNFVQAGFASLQALSRESCRPFDSRRNGLNTGEAIGTMLVLSQKKAKALKINPIATVKGMAVSCDAVHITAPCRNGSGLIRTISQTLKNSDFELPGAINAHGTGTVYNDMMEIKAFRECWPKKIPPVHSVKGATGHCLGASGIVEAVVALKSLKSGYIPPTIGFTKSGEEDLQISGENPLPLLNSSILSCNSGFGGINAAMLFTL